LLSKSGAEGQSRTDTGLPPPVFEFDAMTEHTSGTDFLIQRLRSNA